MNLPNTCPRCGAPKVPGCVYTFECNLAGEFGVESNRCLAGQRDALAARVKELEAELERAKEDRNHAGVRVRRQMLPQMQELSARVKELEAYAERLEKAGDSLQCAVLGEEKMPHWQWLAMAHEADLKWRSAKETKP